MNALARIGRGRGRRGRRGCCGSASPLDTASRVFHPTKPEQHPPSSSPGKPKPNSKSLRRKTYYFCSTRSSSVEGTTTLSSTNQEGSRLCSSVGHGSNHHHHHHGVGFVAPAASFTTWSSSEENDTDGNRHGIDGENNNAIHNNAIHNNNSIHNRLGARLRDLLTNENLFFNDPQQQQQQQQQQNQNQTRRIETSDLAASWNHSEDVFRDSLQGIRILRARAERQRGNNANNTTTNNNNTNTNEDRQQQQQQQHQRIQMIRDCLCLLDKLSESLPRAEEYSSSLWLSSEGDGSTTEYFLDTNLLNDFLKEWMMGWKEQPNHQQQQQQQQQHSLRRHRQRLQSDSPSNNRTLLLPTPSQMAERIDQYRSRYLVQPDPTSFNLLLNAMIHWGGNGNGNGAVHHRIKAVRLADDYLRRLLVAQQRSSMSSSMSSSWNNNNNSNNNNKYVDTVSVTTVMKGWVSLGQPSKAQEWLDTLETNLIPPNAVTYATLIHGWARKGEALKAESVLELALEEASKSIANRMDNNNNNNSNRNGDSGEGCGIIPLVDRVVFHTVLDAWAAKAAVAPATASKGTKGNRIRSGSSKNNNDEESATPSMRAKALVHKMNDLADAQQQLGSSSSNSSSNSSHSSFGQDHLRPNDETWHKLIAVVAASSSSSGTPSARDDEVGPHAAESLLVEFETKHKTTTSVSSTPVVLLNRILGAYCSCGTKMIEAEAFYHNRCRLLLEEEEDESADQQAFADPASFPNEVTFNTILSGWANAAKVAAKKKKPNPTGKPSSSSAAAAAVFEIPFRAEAWLEELHTTLQQQQQHGPTTHYRKQPSTRSYGSVLQAWSLSTKHHKDAADRAEALLRKDVWPLLQTETNTTHTITNTNTNRDGNGGDTEEQLAKGVVICTNIVLRAWSNQTAAAAPNNGGGDCNSGNNSVRRCLWLLRDFLDLVESTRQEEEQQQRGGQPQKQVLRVQLQPTEETFRAVLHAIATPSKSMTPVQKHDHSKALLTCMKERFRLRPSKADLSKFERLKKRRDAFLDRRRRTK